MHHHSAPSPLHTGPARLITAFLLLVGLTGAASAQSTVPLSAQPSAAPTVAAKPTWKELSPEQQQALKPLAAHWERLNADRKRKWLAVSKNYAALSEAEQVKLHSRMREWALLSQQQRNQARLNFAETQKIAPEEKATHWQTYQNLSAEEKRKLAAKAPAKPAGVAAVKPVPPEKLALVPVTRHTSREALPASAASPAIQRNTLLPQAPAPLPVAAAAQPPASEAEPAPEADSDN
jgi:hypothetical protein